MKWENSASFFREYLFLGSILQEFQKYATARRSLELDTPAHPFQPGDWLRIEWWNAEPLRGKGKGPYHILLKTSTAVESWGKGPWIHYSSMKRAPSSWTAEQLAPLKLKETALMN